MLLIFLKCYDKSKELFFSNNLNVILYEEDFTSGEHFICNLNVLMVLLLMVDKFIRR